VKISSSYCPEKDEESFVNDSTVQHFQVRGGLENLERRERLGSRPRNLLWQALESGRSDSFSGAMVPRSDRDS
jgi:hypothetical protein